MPRILKILLLVIIIGALFYWFYQRGGEQPVSVIEEPVGAPAEVAGDE